MLAAGARVGPYEILSWLGAGGMGEVYRARDTKLHREVALKTLPEELARQTERFTRLKQEARILASLNHPGIATLHGLEESDGGVPVLVMELVEGESLADRLRRGPLPLPEALKAAHAIAVALEAAHEKGVLHRDLKPANIRITSDGGVKLLDFGLAKAVSATGLDSQQATETSPSSRTAIVGTAAYMSPEQARGRDVDRRTDVWAFGCVLFEMLAGQRAFGGATFSDTVAAILDREPVWEALPAETPSVARRLMRRCLQKEKDKRLRDVGDARLELEELAAVPGAGSEEGGAASSRPRTAWHIFIGSRLLWSVVGAAASGAGVWALAKSRPVSERPVMRWAIPLSPLGAEPSCGTAWSPDGEHLAYGAGRAGHHQLYRRTLDRLEATPITGTEDGSRPFFSPDGRWLAFLAGDSLKKVPASGGAPITVCDSCGAFGASWGPDGNIVFARDSVSGLFRVSADGGTPQAVTALDASRHELSHRYPDVLPGGQGVVFTVKPEDALSWDEARIEAVSLRTGERSILIKGGACARYVAPGHLVYYRSGSLWAAPFDPARLKVTGPALLMVEGVSSDAEWGFAGFSISRDGTLVYMPGRPQGLDRRVVRVDRTGKSRPLMDDRRNFLDPRLSPDGRRLALQIGGANDQIWVYDLERGTLTPLTSRWNNSAPVWTPDSRRITFTSNRGQNGNLFWQPADGSGSAERLTTSANVQIAESWSPDGRTLVLQDGPDISTLQLDGNRQPRPLARGIDDVGTSALSPNGRWLAYESDESGRGEVYVKPFPGSGSRWAISKDGGNFPVWARNGRELFYLERRVRMMAVEVTSDPTFSVSTARLLFEAKALANLDSTYDVTPDGEFVMIEPGESDEPPSQINVVLNWAQEVRQRVAAR